MLRRPKSLVLVLAGLVIPVCWLLAEEKPDSGSNPLESHQAPPEVHQTESTALLEKTVRLEFKLVHPEDEPTFAILCAIKEYGIQHDVSEPNFEHGIQIAGTVAPLNKQGRLLLTFKAANHHRDVNEGISAQFTVKGSAILEIGKSKTLGTLGESPLKVTATFDE